jgi:hypothetical protein
MLCLRGLAIYMLWSACCTASRLRHLTASFDSFVGLLDVYAGAARMQPRDCSNRWRLAETGTDHAASAIFYGLQPLSRSSNSLPRRRAGMVAAGGALNTERTWQAPSVDKGSAQQKLDLCIAAAQLVMCPPGDCVVDCRIEPEKEAFSLRNCPH